MELSSSVPLENQTNPHAGTSEVTNSAGTLQTPNANASEEEDEAAELIVVPTTVRQVGPRKSLTFLEKHGYRRGTIDKTLFIKKDKKDIMLYVADMLKKFDLASVKTAITPIETKMALTKDEEADEVTLKTSHLNVVKRIFKYLKGKPNLGLWYPRESSFDLEAYSDSDYVGANIDRKSTTGGLMFQLYLVARRIGDGFKVETEVVQELNSYVIINSGSLLLNPGQANQAVDQPSPSEPLPSSSHPPVISATSLGSTLDHLLNELNCKMIEKLHSSLSKVWIQVVSKLNTTYLDLQVVSDLLQLVPKLITKVDSLETELKQTKLTMGKALVKLVKKVKKMEDVLKRRHVALPDSEDEDAKISSKQGRNLQEEGLDEMVRNMMKDESEVFYDSLHKAKPRGGDISPTTLEVAITLSKVVPQRSNTGFEDISTGFKEVNTGSLGVSTDSGPVSSARGQREGKASMIVEETQAPKRTKEQIQQEEASLAEAIRLKTLEEEETAKQEKKLPERLCKEDLELVKSEKEVLLKKELKQEEEKEAQQKFNETKDYDKNVSDAATKVGKCERREEPVNRTLQDRFFIELYRLVMQKYGTNRPEDAYDRVLWSDLRTMFDPPLNEDAIWSLPLQQKEVSSVKRCLPSDAENDASRWKNE
ncbi:hypothetical protein Tco_0455717 [Tanacetum coccineum]